MTSNTGNETTLTHRANLNIAAAVVAKLGIAASDGLIGHVIDEVRASHSVAELASPNGMSIVVGAVDTAIARNAETNRPRNDFSPEAARAAQATGGFQAGRGPNLGTLEALRGGSSARFRDLPASENGTKSGGSSGTSAPVTPEFVRSFAGTGMAGTTLRTFAEVGLDRSTFNAFRQEGFSKEQIVDSAKDSQVLHFKGKEDLTAAQHAPVDLRKAAVGVEQAKTPEQKAQRRDHEADVARTYEALPDSDPRKHRARRFLERLEKHGHHVELGAGKVGARAQQDDASMAKEHGGHVKQPDQKIQDAQSARFKKQTAASLAAKSDDDFGVSATTAPTPSKPAPVKSAAVKPAAGPTPS